VSAISYWLIMNQEQASSYDPSHPSSRIRAELKSQVIFLALALPLCIPAAVVTLNRPDQWHALLFTLLLAAFPQLWLKGFEIRLFEDRLVYKTLFRAPKEVSFVDLTKVSVEVGCSTDMARRNRPFYRLVLLRKGQLANNSMIIDLKPFSRADIAQVARMVVSKAQGADIDQDVQKLSKGDVAPLTGQAVRQFWQAAILIFFLMLVLGLARAIIDAFK